MTDKKYMKKLILVMMTLLGTGCTKKPTSATVSFSLPSSSQALSQSVHAQSGATWGLSDPTTLSDINCYLVLVTGPEAALQSNTCTNSNGDVVAKPGMWAGAFPAGGTAVVEGVPLGKARKFTLVGLVAGDINNCNKAVQNGMDKSLFSTPYILGQGAADLEGGDATVDIDRVFSTASTNQINDCEGPAFHSPSNSSPSGNAPTVNMMNPTSGSPLGGTLVAIAGSNFAAGMSITIAGVPCTGVNVINSSQVTCTTGAHTAGGAYPVVATLSNGLVGTMMSAYTYAPQPLAVQAIKAGSGSVCALVAGGRAKCWGQNNYGEIGSGSAGAVGSSPGQISNNLPFIDVSSLGGLTISQLTTANDTTCAIYSDGSLRCWGNNSLGQLGRGSATPPYIGNSGGPSSLSSQLQAVNLGGGTPISVSVGGSHVCALMADTTIQCWGGNSSGQLGNGNTADSLTPVQVTGLTGATQVFAGRSHTCAIVSGGLLKCWGDNTYGQLGDGTTTMRTSPVNVSTMSTGVTQVTASQSFGNSYTCAIKSGAAYCWGDNAYGQLGDGTVVNRNSPVAVSTLSSGVNQISLGNGHSCALKAGIAYCWGNNSAGQLGLDSTSTMQIPIAVVGLSNVASISLGDVFTCAMMASPQQAKCWGYGVYGALLQGTSTNLGATTGDMNSLGYILLGSE